MAAEPDDDARRTLADLEARLRDLEQELLGGRDPDEVALPPAPQAEPEPEPAPATSAQLDAAALADVNAAAAALAATLESLADTSAEIRVHALALRDEQGAMAARLHGAARA